MLKISGATVAWIFSFLAGEDLTRLDRKMRIAGILLTVAVIVLLTVLDRQSS